MFYYWDVSVHINPWSVRLFKLPHRRTQMSLWVSDEHDGRTQFQLGDSSVDGVWPSEPPMETKITGKQNQTKKSGRWGEAAWLSTWLRAVEEEQEEEVVTKWCREDSNMLWHMKDQRDHRSVGGHQQVISEM